MMKKTEELRARSGNNQEEEPKNTLSPSRCEREKLVKERERSGWVRWLILLLPVREERVCIKYTLTNRREREREQERERTGEREREQERERENRREREREQERERERTGERERENRRERERENRTMTL